MKLDTGVPPHPRNPPAPLREGVREIRIESDRFGRNRILHLVSTLLSPLNDAPDRILYCRCAFAQAVPEAVKNAVLERLCESGASFESVSDLCEMSARKDPRLGALLDGEGTLRIAACYPRAVKWLFHHAGAPLPEDGRVEILNMRESSADEIASALLSPSDATVPPTP